MRYNSTLKFDQEGRGGGGGGWYVSFVKTSNCSLYKYFEAYCRQTNVMYDTTLNDRLMNFCIYISNSLPFMTENGVIIIEQWNALNSRKTAHLCRVQ